MYTTMIPEKMLIPLDLHLFDAQTNVTTDSGMTVEMKTYYHDRLIDHAEPKLVHNQFGQKVPIPANGGKVIEFRKYSPLPKATTALTEGVTPKGRKLEVTALTAEVAQYGDFIEYSDMLLMTAIDRNLDQGTKMQGGQAGRTLDTVTREVLNGGTNKMFAPKVDAEGNETEVLLRADVDGTCQLTPDIVKIGVGMLERMNAEPYDDAFVGIVHPDTATDLMRHKDWVDVHKYATPENIYQGELGMIGGARFVKSTEAKIIGPGFLFGNADSNGVCRMTVESAASGSVTVQEAVTAEQAAELTARIAAGEEVKAYVNGNEVTITAVTAGGAGAAKFTVTGTVSASKGDMFCGYGAGKYGDAIYCTLFVGANAYGVTDISGMGLQHIVKQLGSAGTGDPLNQRATSGWKATATAERLVEEYMLRVEHGGRTFGKRAVSN